MKLTAEEKKAVDEMKRIAKHWPKSLWLFSNGALYVVKKKRGEKAMTPTGGFDPDYVVDTVDIENDGGDW